MVVVEHLVRGKQAGARRTACLWAVAEGTVLLVQRCSARGSRLIRLRAKAQKRARGGSPLFRRHVFVRRMLLRRILTTTRLFLSHCGYRNSEDRSEHSPDNRMAHPHSFLDRPQTGSTAETSTLSRPRMTLRCRRAK